MKLNNQFRIDCAAIKLFPWKRGQDSSPIRAFEPKRTFVGAMMRCPPFLHIIPASKLVAEVESEEPLAQTDEIEKEIRRQVVVSLGVSVRTIFLRPPKWIVESTDGKAALLKFEDLTHMRIPPGKVQPKDMDTIALMFAKAQRVGKVRK